MPIQQPRVYDDQPEKNKKKKNQKKKNQKNTTLPMIRSEPKPPVDSCGLDLAHPTEVVGEEKP